MSNKWIFHNSSDTCEPEVLVNLSVIIYRLHRGGRYSCAPTVGAASLYLLF